MRRIDKLNNIIRANMLAEQRYLKSKGVLNEAINVDLKKFATDTLKPKLEAAGLQVGLFGDKDDFMVMGKVNENANLLGIIWKGPRGSLGPTIALRFNRGKRDVVNSVLSKFQFAKVNGEKKAVNGWGATKQAKDTYNDGDLAITFESDVSIWITKMIKTAQEPKQDNQQQEPPARPPLPNQ